MTEDPWATLTKREKEVAKLIAIGLSGREISNLLGISVKTYDTHRLHIMRKLNVENAVLLTRWMLRRELVSLNSGNVS